MVTIRYSDVSPFTAPEIPVAVPMGEFKEIVGKCLAGDLPAWVGDALSSGAAHVIMKAGTICRLRTAAGLSECPPPRYVGLYKIVY